MALLGDLVAGSVVELTWQKCWHSSSYGCSTADSSNWWVAWSLFLMNLKFKGKKVENPTNGADHWCSDPQWPHDHLPERSLQKNTRVKRVYWSNPVKPFQHQIRMGKGEVISQNKVGLNHISLGLALDSLYRPTPSRVQGGTLAKSPFLTWRFSPSICYRG